MIIKQYTGKLIATLNKYVKIPTYNQEFKQNPIICNDYNVEIHSGTFFRIGIGKSEQDSIKQECRCDISYICTEQEKIKVSEFEKTIKIKKFPK